MQPVWLFHKKKKQTLDLKTNQPTNKTIIAKKKNSENIGIQFFLLRVV